MKRNLVFCQNPRNEETNWIFHEYHLHDVSLGLTLCEQRKYVLCHLVNRQYDYAETLANMEVDPEYEGQRHGLSEEIIQAKVRSLIEGLSPPPSDASLHNPQSTTATLFSMRVADAVDCWDDMEQVMSTNGGDEDILDILNQVGFSTDGESVNSGGFEVASDYEPLFKVEETSREASQKENRRGMPPDTLQGYIFVDETRQSVEEEFHGTEAGDASSIQDCQKDARPDHLTSLDKQPACNPRRTEPRIVCFEGSNRQSTPETGRWQGASPGRYHEIKETEASKPKATCTQSEATKPHPPTLVVRQNTSNRLKTSLSEQKNEETPTTSRTEEGCRAPFEYLVNLGVGTFLLVLILLWLLMH
ncbi:hypothetical protein MLD38_013726 [Melastoma candidum]|uniref:Uncharacterized protein n=1 Tax=Melastoma candidum TaxID=119954 RepID=A0ACB9RCB9_9MYRT|nr:hypothetical protein MLD38_013726 [Melastoma candidum]